MRHSSTRLAAIVTIAFVLSAGAGAAETTNRVMIVLDASGSMWGQIEGTTKIEIARDVLGDLLADWDEGVELGLVAYGHRREGDCGDIEIVVPQGGGAEAVSGAVRSIQPKGKTPLSEAVRQAAQALRYADQRATVVLISDGEETCNADPCAVGAELAMGGVDFTAHVVGFDLTEEQQAGLRCLAENTGGLFLAAADAGELSDALAEAVDQVEEPPAPVVEDPGEASVEAPDQVAAGSRFEVGFEGPNSRGDYVTVVVAGAKQGDYGSYAYSERGSPAVLTAPDQAGAYEVRYVHGHSRAILGSDTVTVTEVTATLEAPDSIGAGGQISVTWTGPDNQGDYVTIVPVGAPASDYLGYAYTRSGSPGTVTAPEEPGSYELRYITGQSRSILAKTPITVVAVTASLDAATSIAAGGQITVTWTGPDNSGDYITIAPAGSPASDYLGYAYSRNGSPAKFQAPDEPGDYEVRYITGQSRAALASISLTVEPVTASFDFPGSVAAGGEVVVSWQGPNNKGDYISIAAAGSADSAYATYGYTRNGSPLAIKAPNDPGSYEVRYIMGQSRTVLARAPLRVD